VFLNFCQVPEKNKDLPPNPALRTVPLFAKMSDAAPSESVSGTVAVRRPREYLTETEIDRLITTARKATRYGHRDATAIMVAYNHGLRSSELVALEWDQIDLARKTIRIERVKGGDASTHYLSNSELRALRRLQRENPPGPHVFISERGGPVTTAWFRKMFARLGERAGMPFAIHPHQLRHSCGYRYANQGKDTRSLQAYLGHRSINSTVRYTAMSPTRFQGWEKE
jgi:integrase